MFAEKYAYRFGPLVFMISAAGLVTVRDPHVHGSWGVCPTYAILGVYCPGCGTLRGLHDLAAGQVSEAVGHNALLLPMVLFSIYAAVKGSVPYESSYVWLVVVVIFTALRNLPGSPLAP
jgi:hypothetical protein